ncbi:MAG: GntR family transcriptional regulator [Spirosomataceae bacterium]
MQFRDNKPIYLQIAEYMGDKILSAQWQPDQKIPSIRETAVALQVNPNTVQRTYEFLENKHIIYTKRGLGYFVSLDGVEQVQLYRKEQFFEEDLPLIFKNMQVLGIDTDEFIQRFETWKLSL